MKVKIGKPTPKSIGKALKLEKKVPKNKDNKIFDGTGMQSIKSKVKESAKYVETNEKKKHKTVKEKKVKQNGEVITIIPAPMSEKMKKCSLKSVKQVPKLVPKSANIKKDFPGPLQISNKKGKKEKLNKVGLPPPPKVSPKLGIKPIENKNVKSNKKEINKKAKARIGLPPPPAESPEPPKPLAKIKNDGKKKTKLNVKTSTAGIIIKPKVEKLQKAKKELGKSSANKVQVKGKKSKNSSPLSKAKKKKGLSGKKAYDKRKLRQQKAKLPKIFEAVEYDAEKFDTICNEENIERIAEALKTLAESEVAQKKTSIFGDYRYNLNVACFKIPSCPKRMVKLNLIHSLVGTDDDVVIVVADVQRGAKADYEPTIEHYEDLFEKNGIEGLKIMPFNQLRKECKTFEAVRKFGNTYDYFLADGRIVGQLVGFCGKIFQKPRTTFHSVHFDKTNLKGEIERALLRTAYKQLHKGDLISIPIANHTHSPKEVAENAYHVITQLKTQYPGGMENVRGIYLKIDITGTSALPIYLSMSKAPEKSPYVVGPREKRMLKLRKEANDILGNFRLSKEGDLIKLSKKEVERKRKIKEAKAKLAEQNEEKIIVNPDKEDEAQDNDGDEDVIPSKKPRPDTDVQSGVNKKTVEKDETTNDDGGKDEEDSDNSSEKSEADGEEDEDSADDDEEIEDEDVEEEDDADENDTNDEDESEGDEDDDDNDDE